MLTFLTQNIATIIIGLIVLSIVVLAVRKMIKDKKNHKSSCSCGCTNCPSAKMCHH